MWGGMCVCKIYKENKLEMILFVNIGKDSNKSPRYKIFPEKIPI